MAVYGGFCAWVIIQDAVFNVCHIVISESHAQPGAHADFACLQIHLAIEMGEGAFSGACDQQFFRRSIGKGGGGMVGCW